MAATIIALLIPVILCGMRDASVGTDVAVYAFWMFQSACVSSFGEFLKNYASEANLLFNVLTWLSCHPFGSFALYLGAIETAVIVPFYFAARRVSKEGLWIAFLAYALFLLPVSLNAMKQMVAASFLFLAATYAFDRDLKRFILWYIVAMLFHQTAAVGLLLYPFIVAYLSSYSGTRLAGGRKRTAMALLLIALFAVGACVLYFGLSWLASIKGSYSYALDNRDAGLDNAMLVLLVFVTAVLLLTSDAARAEDGLKGADMTPLRVMRCFLCLVAIGCLAMQLGVIAQNLLRFGYYGLIFLPSAIQLMLCCRKMPLGRLVVAAFLLYLAAYFVHVYVGGGAHGVYPFLLSEGLF
ncbi:EpsG family protein [Adlercreutzia sp. ZJ242]|uniref:EpsG family protein n=1 Tax=Adlercreutzia sp. ZJ242 TaxID=2709409 RepID=UPI0013EC67E3|nr:EpsG family protein [Adlercreutzia sp. ZJ242]